MIKAISLLLLFPTLLFAAIPHSKSDAFHQESTQKEINFTKAPWGTLEEQTSLQQYNWPFALQSIGHSIASYQKYGWQQGYFHHGLDIRGEAGQTVTAATGGLVVNIENYASSDLYWEIAILDNTGLLWQYHHVDHDSIPQAIHDAYKNQTPITAGTKLGEIVYWPVVTFGERFNHVHLNVLDKNLAYVNPFFLLKPLDDRTAPTIHDIGLIINGRISKKDSIAAGSDYSLYLHVEDYIMHNKFKLPPYKVWYQLNGEEKQLVWQFKHLPGGSDREAYLDEFYQDQTCGNYDCRDIYINLNFSKKEKRSFPQVVSSNTITVWAEDFAGNTTESTYQWKVK